MPYNVQEIVQQLQDNPRKLLRRVFLVIAGGAGGGGHGIFTFKAELANQAVTGFTTGLSGLFGRTKDRQLARITHQGVRKAVLAADEFDAHYLAMVGANPADRHGIGTHHALPNPPAGGDPTLFITSGLSGCHFGVGSSAAGALLVSHVEGDRSLPLADPNPRATNQTAVVHGGMHAVNADFRKRQEYAETAAVVGRYQGGGWRFYGQAQNYDDGRVIETATRIY